MEEEQVDKKDKEQYLATINLWRLNKKERILPQ